MDEAPASASDFDGTYKLLGELKSGSRSVVYRAEQQKLGREIAIKVLRERLPNDPLIREQFNEELRPLAALKHPNLVAISGFGIVGDAPYIAMELLEGETLEARLQRGPLPLELAEQIIQALLRALAYMHVRGLVHRNLSPSSMFLVVTAEGVQLKLIDYGLTQLPSAQKNPAAALPPQTAAYGSPEQIAGEDVDARSDVFSTGSIILQMMTGGSLAHTADEVSSGRTMLAPQPVAAASPEFHEFLSRALAPERYERFGNADQMLRGLLELPTPWFEHTSLTLELEAAANTQVASGVPAQALDATPEPEPAPAPPPLVPAPRPAAKPRRWPWLVAGAVAVTGGLAAAGFVIMQRLHDAPPSAAAVGGAHAAAAGAEPKELEHRGPTAGAAAQRPSPLAAAGPAATKPWQMSDDALAQWPGAALGRLPRAPLAEAAQGPSRGAMPGFAPGQSAGRPQPTATPPEADEHGVAPQHAAQAANHEGAAAQRAATDGAAARRGSALLEREPLAGLAIARQVAEHGAAQRGTAPHGALEHAAGSRAPATRQAAALLQGAQPSVLGPEAQHAAAPGDAAQARREAPNVLFATPDGARPDNASVGAAEMAALYRSAAAERNAQPPAATGEDHSAPAVSIEALPDWARDPFNKRLPPPPAAKPASAPTPAEQATALPPTGAPLEAGALPPAAIAAPDPARTSEQAATGGSAAQPSASAAGAGGSAPEDAKPGSEPPPPTAAAAPALPQKPRGAVRQVRATPHDIRELLMLTQQPEQPRTAARDPWEGSLPKELAELREAIGKGEHGTPHQVAVLRRFCRKNPEEAIGHLLLAGLYENRGWSADALDQYEVAYMKDPSVRGAPEMLRDTLRMVQTGVAETDATRFIARRYQREALPAIDRALRDKSLDKAASARLQKLRARITSGSR